MKSYIIPILLGLTIPGLSACKKLDLAPLDKPSDITFWQTAEDAVNAVNACYSDLYSAETLLFAESLSDNAYTRSNNGNQVRDVANGNYDAAHPLMQQVWSQRYVGIRRCNTLLANIDRVEGMDEGLNRRLKAETRFIRAFHYFTLLDNFGGVPLVDREITIEESAELTRNTKEEVLDFIYNDLDAALSDLPRKDEYAAADAGRITKGAVLALQAKVQLYNREWQNVVETTAQIMDGLAGTYRLFDRYGDLFKMENENNAEILLDVQFMPIRRTHNIQYFYIPPTEGGYAALSPSQELVDNYLMLNGKGIAEAGSGYEEEDPYTDRDPRMAATIVYDGYPWLRSDGSTFTIQTRPGSGQNSLAHSSNTTPTGYYVAKIFDPSAQNLVNSGLNLIVLRYADVLLMHAEAKNELSALDAATWDQTVRLLRIRAGFTEAAAIEYAAGKSQSDWREIIRRERRTELAMEGSRIFDIRRWEIGAEVLNGWLHGMKTDRSSEDNGYERVDLRSFDPAKHYLWPIPQTERDRNANLVQNPGW